MKTNFVNPWGWVAAIVWMICTTVIVVVTKHIPYLHLLWICLIPIALGCFYIEEDKK